MNDEDYPVPAGLRLIEVIGGLRPQASVRQEPSLTLLNWRAYESPGGNIHLAGHCVELAEGRATSSVVAGDAAARRCATVSGRQYTLEGPPGHLDSSAAWVWVQFKRINFLVNEVDVSDQLFKLLPGLQPRCDDGR